MTDPRHGTEAVQQTDEAAVRMALRAANVGLWDWDLASGTVRYSREWKRQLGYDEHEIGEEFNEWKNRLHPDDLGPAMERIERYLAHPRGPYESEFRMRHKDGSWRWIYSRGEFSRDGAPPRTRILGCHMDITDRKRAESLLRSTIDAISASTAVVDHTGRIFTVNRAWREFAARNGGGGPEMLEGASYLAVCDAAAKDHPAAAAIATSLRAVLAGRSDPEPVEYDCHSPDEKRWFQACIHGFDCGNERFAVVMHQNVTVVRAAAEREAAAERREALATIAAGVAHEFNSILLATSLQLHRLRGDGSPGHPAAKAILLVRQAQVLAAALLDLYFGPQEIEGRWLSLYPWLGETVARLAIGLPPDVHVSTHIARDLPEVHAHPLGLEQVVRNLLSNAARALGTAGEIAVSAGAAAIGGKSMVELRVSNSGPSIPEAERERVFEAGFTTDPEAVRTGLGLAIARRLLDQFGGEIQYEPGTNGGSTFVVRLLASCGETS